MVHKRILGPKAYKLNFLSGSNSHHCYADSSNFRRARTQYAPGPKIYNPNQPPISHQPVLAAENYQ